MSDKQKGPRTPEVQIQLRVIRNALRRGGPLDDDDRAWLLDKVDRLLAREDPAAVFPSRGPGRPKDWRRRLEITFEIIQMKKRDGIKVKDAIPKVAQRHCRSEETVRDIYKVERRSCLRFYENLLHLEAVRKKEGY